MPIRFVQHGDWSRTTRFLQRCLSLFHKGTFDHYGQLGVDALREATPIDSGATANAWGYHIDWSGDSIKIEWTNSNNVDGAPIAVLLQYGHATRSGSWVEGRDYINPAIRPIFEKIADDVWKEVTSS